MLKIFFVVVFISLGLLACKSSKSSNQITDVLVSEQEVKDYALKNIGEGYELLYNDDRKYVIAMVKHKRNQVDPFPTIRFEILKVEGLEKLHKDVMPTATIKWKDTHIVEVKSQQAIPRPDGKIKKKAYTYNVINRIKLPIG